MLNIILFNQLRILILACYQSLREKKDVFQKLIFGLQILKIRLVGQVLVTAFLLGKFLIFIQVFHFMELFFSFQFIFGGTSASYVLDVKILFLLKNTRLKLHYKNQLSFFVYNNQDQKLEITMFSQIKLRGWTEEEQEYLRYLKEEEKIKTWKKIAKRMMGKFQQKMRTEKQCRERYQNYARFEGEPASDWSSSEQKLMIKFYLEIGPNWKKISEEFNKLSKQGEYWSPNFLKNKFYNALRKFLTKLNSFNKNAPKIKLQSFQRILSLRLLADGQIYGDLADQILILSQTSQREISEEEAEKMKNQIKEFNKTIKIPIYSQRCRAVPEEMDQDEEMQNNKIEDTNKIEEGAPIAQIYGPVMGMPPFLFGFAQIAQIAQIAKMQMEEPAIKSQEKHFHAKIESTGIY